MAVSKKKKWTKKELKKFKEAKNHYQKAIKIKPDFIDAHKNLMQMFETMNQDEELKDAIKKARTLIKDNPIINLYEGILLCKNEKFAEAKNCLESISFGSREINKEILRVSNLAKCYDRIGDYEKAFDFFLKTNDLAPQKTDVENFDKGIVYLTLRGACAGCPSSTATLKQGIENLLKHYFPEVKEIRALN